MFMSMLQGQPLMALALAVAMFALSHAWASAKHRESSVSNVLGGLFFVFTAALLWSVASDFWLK
jgi:hypothetical protein